MRRSLTLEVAPLLAELGADDGDETARRVLDAAGELIVAHGLRRCSVEDIAERSGVGRTTIYRRFEGRDQILYSLLGREARRFFAAIAAAVMHHDSLEDRLTTGFLAGLAAVESSSLGSLLRDPAFVTLLTDDAGAVVVLARDALLDAYRRMTGRPPDEYAATVAEALIRLGFSYALVPGPAPVDPVALRRLISALLAGG